MSDEEASGDLSPDFLGAGDNPHLTPVQGNKIVATFLNPQKKFPFSIEVAKFAIRTTIKNMRDPDSRVRNGAVRNLAMLTKIDQADEHKRIDVLMSIFKPERDKQSVNVNVGVGVGVNANITLGQVVRELIESDPDYVQWKRNQVLGIGGDADPVGEAGIIGGVSDPPAPDSPGECNP